MRDDTFRLLSTPPMRLQEIDKLKGEVVAYWSSFGNRDSYGDTMVQGCYDDTIKDWGPQGKDLIAFLWNHSFFGMPVGKPVRLVEDDFGLLATVNVSKTAQGADLLILYEDEVINQHSVGIDILERDDEDTSLILKCRLWEGSAVVWAANQRTPTVSVKAAVAADTHFSMLFDQCKNMRRVLHDRPITDETGVMLTGALKVLEARLQDAEQALAPSQTPTLTPSMNANNAFYSALSSELDTLLNEMR